MKNLKVELVLTRKDGEHAALINGQPAPIAHKSNPDNFAADLGQILVKMLQNAPNAALLLALTLLGGCMMKGELRRCYGLAVPFVKVGVCERLPEPIGYYK